MSEPLKAGDVCLVVRDIANRRESRCFGALVGTPVTLDAPFTGSKTPVWFVRGDLPCPVCKRHIPFLFAAELQKLRGPEQFGDVDGLVGVDENGNGWRLCGSGERA